MREVVTTHRIGQQTLATAPKRPAPRRKMTETQMEWPIGKKSMATSPVRSPPWNPSVKKPTYGTRRQIKPYSTPANVAIPAWTRRRNV